MLWRSEWENLPKWPLTSVTFVLLVQSAVHFFVARTYCTALPVKMLTLDGQQRAFVQKCLLYVVPCSARSFCTFGITSIDFICKSGVHETFRVTIQQLEMKN